MNYPAASSGVSKPAKPKSNMLRSKLRGIEPGEIKNCSALIKIVEDYILSGFREFQKL